MADVSYLSAETLVGTSANGTISVTVPSSANAILVLVTGFSDAPSDPMLEVLNFDAGTTQDFATIVEQRYSSLYTGISASAYIITDNSGAWPGTGSATLTYETGGTYSEGYNIHVLYLDNVDAADPVGDVESADSDQSAGDSFTSALTGVGSGDMGVIFGYTFGSAGNAAPSGSGQTLVSNGVHNSAGISSGYKLEEDALELTGDYLVPVAFALNADSGGGGLTVAPGFISSGSAVYSPTVSVGGVSVAIGAIASALSVFSPSISVAGSSVAPGHIASTAALYSPAVTVGVTSVAPGHIASTATVFSPTLSTDAVAVAPGHIASTAAVFSPALSTGGVAVALGHIATTASVYSPAVSVGATSVAPGHISSTAALYSPGVSAGGVAVAPGHIASTAALYEPTVIAGEFVAPGHIASTLTVYAPEVKVVGTALDLDGSTEYSFTELELDADAGLTSGEFTIQFWADPDAPSDLTPIIGHDSNDSDGMTIAWASSGTPTLRMKFTSGARIADAATPHVSGWTHYTVVRDPPLAHVYINGALDNTISGNSGAGKINHIGRHRVNKYAGGLDDLRIWSRALSGAEVAANWDTHLDSDTDLEVVWDFESDTTDSVLDAVGSRDGTRVGGSWDHISGAAPPAPPDVLDVEPGHIASTATLYGPTLSAGGVSVALDAIASTATTYAPSLGLAVAPGHIASTSTVYAPSVAAGGLSVLPGHIASTAAFYAPTVAAGGVSVALGVIASTAALYEPTVTVGDLAVSPEHIVSTLTVYAPAVDLPTTNQEVSPQSIPSVATLYEPTVTHQELVSPDHIASTLELYPPTVIDPAYEPATEVELRRPPQPTKARARLMMPVNIDRWDVPAEHPKLSYQLNVLKRAISETIPAALDESTARLDGGNVSDVYVTDDSGNGAWVRIGDTNISATANIAATKLAHGTSAQVLTTLTGASGLYVGWATPSSGSSLTAPLDPSEDGLPAVASGGDLVYQQISDSHISSSASIAVSKMAAGANGTVMTSLVGASVWQKLSNTHFASSAQVGLDKLIDGTVSGTYVRWNGSSLEYSTLNADDLGNGDVSVLKLDPGANNQALITSGGVPTWSLINDDQIASGADIDVDKLDSGSVNSVLASNGSTNAFSSHPTVNSLTSPSIRSTGQLYSEGYLQLQDASSPPSPSTNRARIYVESGTVTVAHPENVTELTDQVTVAAGDLSSAHSRRIRRAWQIAVTSTSFVTVFNEPISTLWGCMDSYSSGENWVLSGTMRVMWLRAGTGAGGCELAFILHGSGSSSSDKLEKKGVWNSFDASSANVTLGDGTNFSAQVQGIAYTSPSTNSPDSLVQLELDASFLKGDRSP